MNISRADYDAGLYGMEKTILITGGTGSFGSAYIKHLLSKSKSEYLKIICFSRCWLKQKELRDSIGNPSNMRWFIGDIRDKERLLMATKNADIVIHAAAIKDLDACNYNPSEATKTNVEGTHNVINACINNKVDKCLLISTDKAVAPINTYGASKAMAEHLWVNANKYAADDNIKFSVCRYGNVVGSNGSIVPVWLKMIKDGVTVLPVTHPDMTRFWFEMKDVLSFVENSLELMQGGEIFIPELPSTRIVDVVTALGCSYKIIGIREGEKISETMGQEFDSGNNPWFLTIEEIRQSIVNYCNRSEGT
jgi:UDP-N-acetylglucosamine 4,6-dehydratase